MKRSIFTSMLVLLFAFLSCYGVEGKGTPQKKEIAIQLYSARSLINAYLSDPADNGTGYTAVLNELGKMGYTAVEAAGYKEGKFYNRTPEEFKQDVERAGMKVLSSHCGRNLSDAELASGDFTESLAWWDRAIAAHKLAGMEYVVVPSMKVPTTIKGLQVYCDYFNEVGRKCKQNGLKFGYHNHSFEFKKVEDEMMMDYLIENTDPELVFIQLDLYWSVIGDNSPVDYFKKYPGRFKLLHIKDLRELGQSGMVGFDAIFANVDVAGVENIVVEIETYSYGVLESIKHSINYLIEAPFVKAVYGAK